jgi:RHS repeat-associated protein
VSNSLSEQNLSVERGNKTYELSNHLGNVLATITDKPILVYDNGVFDYKSAEISSVSDYFPFGQNMPNRYWQSDSYIWGFNGKENLTELKGWQDYGERMYNRLIGRPPSIDPLTKDFPELSPCQFFSNNPIWFIDLDGLEGIPAKEKPDGTWTTAVDASWIKQKYIQELPKFTSVGGNFIVPSEQGSINIASPNKLRDFESWLSEPSSNFSEGALKVGANIGYSFANSPAIVFTGHSLAGTKQTPSQKMDAFVDFAPGLMLGGISKSSQVIKTTDKAFGGFNEFVKKGGKEIVYPGISKDLPAGTSWQKHTGDILKQNKISQQGLMDTDKARNVLNITNTTKKELEK